MTHLAVAAMLSLTVAQARYSVDVSFGWRFRMGMSGGSTTPQSAYCNSSSYPSSGLNNRQVFGLSQARGVSSVSDCLQAACNIGAQLYQFCPGGGAACGTVSCWIGSYPGTSGAGSGWISGLNTNATAIQGFKATPIEAEASFADGSWNVIDLPHGEVIACACRTFMLTSTNVC